ncbi:hypothetical protein M6B38_158290 [Iris pallida]|uniref:Uncharacterized protein n=2 Tax=Iris pallida TaxID=29817 RepID=A0AAX6F1M8_IRIPA|nr:hypothetical protein M6B38_158285 [Iris pallida]KAJ6810204.1 hypothetical protein M6B38_158290 [Iris pallida]
MMLSFSLNSSNCSDPLDLGFLWSDLVDRPLHVVILVCMLRSVMFLVDSSRSVDRCLFCGCVIIFSEEFLQIW